MFVFSEIYNHKSLYGPIVSGGTVNTTSQFRSSAMLVLRLWEIEKYDMRIDFNGTTSIPHFIQIHPAVVELNHADSETWSVLYAFISCTSCK
jgi:hypothetical protein